MEFYHQFNEALYTELNRREPAIPVTGTPASNDTGIPSAGELTGKGTLVVQVSLAKGAIPVEGARVVVSLEDKTLGDFLTDKSGKTPVLTLPAPNRKLSQTPDGLLRPYSIYNLRISYPGYYVEEAINIPIFDGVNSIQPVALIPLPEEVAPNTEILIDESNQGPV